MVPVQKISRAHPSKLLRYVKPLGLPLLILSGFLLGVGFVWGWFFSPPDYQQGEAARIMYVHVPASWMAVFVYAFQASLSLVFLVWRHQVAIMLMKLSLPFGFAFATLSLLTGAIWGKPMWGAWWAWDARLTSMLILWFIYLGLMGMKDAFGEQSKGATILAITTLVGAINLPIIKWSVYWWNTLHQPASLMKIGKPAIHSVFLGPLFCMFLGYIAFFLGLLILSYETEILVRKRLTKL
jgi:heme exporter protein C